MRAPAVLCLFLLVACKDKPEHTLPPAPSAVEYVAPQIDAKALVTQDCLMCHREDMLRQQHLTAAQWTNVVKKMISWGAPVEPNEAPALTAYLAATYGVDGGAFVPVPVPAESAAAELAAEDDGRYAGGDAARGGATFMRGCSPCHGANARGQVGVNLVDRPMLRRAGDVARLLHDGRGRMPPFPALKDTDVADLLTYLRGLRGA